MKLMIFFVVCFLFIVVCSAETSEIVTACRAQLGIGPARKIPTKKRLCFIYCMKTTSGQLVVNPVDFTIDVEETLDRNERVPKYESYYNGKEDKELFEKLQTYGKNKEKIDIINFIRSEILSTLKTNQQNINCTNQNLTNKKKSTNILNREMNDVMTDIEMNSEIIYKDQDKTDSFIPNYDANFDYNDRLSQKNSIFRSRMLNDYIKNRYNSKNDQIQTNGQNSIEISNLYADYDQTENNENDFSNINNLITVNYDSSYDTTEEPDFSYRIYRNTQIDSSLSNFNLAQRDTINQTNGSFSLFKQNLYKRSNKKSNLSIIPDETQIKVAKDALAGIFFPNYSPNQNYLNLKNFYHNSDENITFNINNRTTTNPYLFFYKIKTTTISEIPSNINTNYEDIHNLLNYVDPTETPTNINTNYKDIHNFFPYSDPSEVVQIPPISITDYSNLNLEDHPMNKVSLEDHYEIFQNNRFQTNTFNKITNSSSSTEKIHPEIVNDYSLENKQYDTTDSFHQNFNNTQTFVNVDNLYDYSEKNKTAMSSLYTVNPYLLFHKISTYETTKVNLDNLTTTPSTTSNILHNTNFTTLHTGIAYVEINKPIINSNQTEVYKMNLLINENHYLNSNNTQIYKTNLKETNHVSSFSKTNPQYKTGIISPSTLPNYKKTFKINSNLNYLLDLDKLTEFYKMNIPNKNESEENNFDASTEKIISYQDNVNEVDNFYTNKSDPIFERYLKNILNGTNNCSSDAGEEHEKNDNYIVSAKIKLKANTNTDDLYSAKLKTFEIRNLSTDNPNQLVYSIQTFYYTNTNIEKPLHNTNTIPSTISDNSINISNTNYVGNNNHKVYPTIPQVDKKLNPDQNQMYKINYGDSYNIQPFSKVNQNEINMRIPNNVYDAVRKTGIVNKSKYHVDPSNKTQVIELNLPDENLIRTINFEYDYPNFEDDINVLNNFANYFLDNQTEQPQIDNHNSVIEKNQQNEMTNRNTGGYQNFEAGEYRNKMKTKTNDFYYNFNETENRTTTTSTDLSQSTPDMKVNAGILRITDEKVAKNERDHLSFRSRVDNKTSSLVSNTTTNNTHPTYNKTSNLYATKNTIIENALNTSDIIYGTNHLPADAPYFYNDDTNNIFDKNVSQIDSSNKANKSDSTSEKLQTDQITSEKLPTTSFDKSTTKTYNGNNTVDKNIDNVNSKANKIAYNLTSGTITNSTNQTIDKNEGYTKTDNPLNMSELTTFTTNSTQTDVPYFDYDLNIFDINVSRTDNLQKTNIPNYTYISNPNNGIPGNNDNTNNLYLTSEKNQNFDNNTIDTHNISSNLDKKVNTKTNKSNSNAIANLTDSSLNKFEDKLNITNNIQGDNPLNNFEFTTFKPNRVQMDHPPLDLNNIFDMNITQTNASHINSNKTQSINFNKTHNFYPFNDNNETDNYKFAIQPCDTTFKPDKVNTSFTNITKAPKNCSYPIFENKTIDDVTNNIKSSNASNDNPVIYNTNNIFDVNNAKYNDSKNTSNISSNKINSFGMTSGKSKGDITNDNLKPIKAYASAGKIQTMNSINGNFSSFNNSLINTLNPTSNKISNKFSKNLITNSTFPKYNKNYYYNPRLSNIPKTDTLLRISINTTFRKNHADETSFDYITNYIFDIDKPVINSSINVNKIQDISNNNNKTYIFNPNYKPPESYRRRFGKIGNQYFRPNKGPSSFDAKFDRKSSYASKRTDLFDSMYDNTKVNTSKNNYLTKINARKYYSTNNTDIFDPSNESISNSDKLSFVSDSSKVLVSLKEGDEQSSFMKPQPPTFYLAQNDSFDPNFYRIETNESGNSKSAENYRRTLNIIYSQKDPFYDKIKYVLEKCKNAAKGISNYCSRANKIGSCIKRVTASIGLNIKEKLFDKKPLIKKATSKPIKLPILEESENKKKTNANYENISY